MNKPLVSVMIATYNQDKYIEKTIDSILEQSYNNIEIIISDDSTNDITKKIVKSKYLNKSYNGKKIIYVHNKPSRGEIGNYRYLLYELASGEWAMNVDGDDFLYNKDFIKIAIDYVINNSNIVLVTSKRLDYYLYDDRFIKIDNIPCENFKTSGDWLFFNHIFKNVEIPHVGTIFNKKRAIEVGFYEYDIPSSDRESLLKLSLRGGIVYLNGYYGAWVHHGENHSQNISINELFENVKMYDRLYDYAGKMNISKLKLFLWKIIAKHKMFFPYYKSIKNKSDFIKRLLKYSKLQALLLMIDIRIYRG